MLESQLIDLLLKLVLIRDRVAQLFDFCFRRF